MKLIIASVAGVMLSTVAASNDFEKTDNIIFRPTKQAVNLGTFYQPIEWKPVSPCSLDSVTDWYSANDVKKKAYHKLNEDCQDHYKQKVQAELEKFKVCTKRRSKNNSRTKPKKKSKRFIDPFSLFVYAMVALVVVGWFGSIYTAWTTDTRMDDFEAREKTTDEKNKQRDAKMAELERDLERARQDRNNTIFLVDKLGEKVETLKEAIDHLALLSGPLAFLAADMKINILKEGEMISRMTDSCLKGEASAADFVTLLNITNLKGVQNEETYIDSVRFDGIYTIDLYYTLYSEEATVYKVESIPQWLNPVQRDRKLMEYKGPSHVVFNRTNNCIKGLPNPLPQQITTRCLEANYEDPALNNWQQVDENRADFEQLKQPKIIQSFQETIISCPFHQIKYDNLTQEDCPPHAFKLPVLTPFSVYDQSYEVKIEPMVVKEHDYIVKAPRLERGTGDKYWNYLIHTAYKDNRNSLPIGRFGYNQETVSVPLNGWVITACVAIACLLIVGCVLCLFGARACIREKHAKNPSQSPHDNGINQPTYVINNRPATIIQPSAQPPTQMQPLYSQRYAYPGLHVYDVPTA